LKDAHQAEDKPGDHAEEAGAEATGKELKVASVSINPTLRGKGARSMKQLGKN